MELSIKDDLPTWSHKKSYACKMHSKIVIKNKVSFVQAKSFDIPYNFTHCRKKNPVKKQQQ